jgi:hypothetical protein
VKALEEGSKEINEKDKEAKERGCKEGNKYI